MLYNWYVDFLAAVGRFIRYLLHGTCLSIWKGVAMYTCLVEL